MPHYDSERLSRQITEPFLSDEQVRKLIRDIELRGGRADMGVDWKQKVLDSFEAYLKKE